jgi:hypothetical protein
MVGNMMYLFPGLVMEGSGGVNFGWSTWQGPNNGVYTCVRVGKTLGLILRKGYSSVMPNNNATPEKYKMVA